MVKEGFMLQVIKNLDNGFLNYSLFIANYVLIVNSVTRLRGVSESYCLVRSSDNYCQRVLVPFCDGIAVKGITAFGYLDLVGAWLEFREGF